MRAIITESKKSKVNTYSGVVIQRNSGFTQIHDTVTGKLIKVKSDDEISFERVGD
jgi:ribosomal protein L19